MPSAFSAAFCVRVVNIELFSYYFTMFMTPLFLFSGVFFPLHERLTPLWQAVAELLPLVHPVRLAHAAFHGGVGPLTIVWDVVYCVVLSGALIVHTRRHLERKLTT